MCLPGIACVKEIVPIAKASLQRFDRYGDVVIDWNAKAEVGDGVVAEIVRKLDCAQLGVAFVTIELAAKNLEASGEIVLTASLTPLARVSEFIFDAINGDGVLRIDGSEDAGNEYLGTKIVWFGNDEGTNSIEPYCEAGDCGGGPCPIPSEVGAVGASSSIRILTFYELESNYFLGEISVA